MRKVLRTVLVASIVGGLAPAVPVAAQTSTAPPPTAPATTTPASAASSDGAPVVKQAYVDAALLIEASDRPVTPVAAGPGRASAPVPSWTFWIYNYVDGQFCRQRVTTRNPVRVGGLHAHATTQALPECARPPRSGPDPTPDDLARRFWDVRLLPTPGIEVVPDFAVPKPVCLQIHGEPAKTFHVDNPLGDDVAITATSSYEIDWGDGSPWQTTTSQGGPWPSGDVTHTYTHMAPAATITVTQRWTATWAAGATRGTLDGLRTATSLALPVTQLQAVRNF